MHLLIGTLATLLAASGSPADTVPLYGDLGDHHYEISTSEPLVQRYFDQGLRLYYAFNHQEAIRSFRAAQELDPECAMCWWGEALAWGPNINLPMDSAAGVAAHAAVQRAVQVKDRASERERAFIQALALRYEPVPSDDRAALDSAYARAMVDVHRRFPEDPEAAVLHAEAQMTLRPWDYWTEDGKPHPGIPEALAALEQVMARNAEHPGACHFYIHADETYIQDQRPGLGVYTAGYYPHNYDFMAFAATMAGRSGQTVEAARKMTEVVPEEILRSVEPAEDLRHARGMWHYARGRALGPRATWRAPRTSWGGCAIWPRGPSWRAYAWNSTSPSRCSGSAWSAADVEIVASSS